MELIDCRSGEIIDISWTPPKTNIEKLTRHCMFLRFCKVRCRENRWESVPELFPTTPTNQNPIWRPPGPRLCKVYWSSDFSVFEQFFSFFATNVRTCNDEPQVCWTFVAGPSLHDVGNSPHSIYTWPLGLGSVSFVSRLAVSMDRGPIGVQ